MNFFIRPFVKLFPILLLSGSCLHAQVNTERYRGTEQDGFSGLIDINLRLNTGNVDVFDSGGGVRIDFRHNRHKSFIVTKLQYAVKKSDAFVNRGFNHIRYNLTIHSRADWEIFIQNEFNEFTRLFSRTLAGIGGRFLMVKRDSASVFFGTTYMLEHEHLDIVPGSNDQSRTRAHRWSNYLVILWRISNRVSLANTMYAQPRFDDFDDLRVLNELAIEIPLTSRLYMNVSFNVRYDSRPPFGVKTTDTELYNSLSFEF